ncbi:MAG: diguanylate cyclase [Clostridia bacterium]|nr:diguanylate cyclase [Clostridia bacterium]
MHSIKTKITALTMSVVIIAMSVAAGISVSSMRSVGTRNANQILTLLCETGQKNLNHYFESVEQSVEMVSTYVESDLDGLQTDKLQAHLDRVNQFFTKLTYNTFGVLTYYYRIDPTVSEQAKGFWYVNLHGDGFKEHEVTDITAYDTNDTTQLVWFTVPKASGKGVWLPPYITDNLNKRVISYNVPVYYQKQFVGVIGIEIDYSSMAQEIDHITLYDNGYAFLNDEQGTIIYHPRMDVTHMKEQPKAPDGLLSESSTVVYTYEGVKKQAVWLPLSNGMRLNVTVPVKEINAEWQNRVNIIIAVFALLLIGFIILIWAFVGKLTKPLHELTEAAEQIGEGNYDCKLDYAGNDEVGILTKTFTELSSNLKQYIGDLNDLAYADSLTSLHNKGAFDICIKNMQSKLEEPKGTLEFAICIFDCNWLKRVNDQNGHDKGDIYLKEAANIICEVFMHSPVFRIGGDEFAALLLDGDYRDREALLESFDKKCSEVRREKTEAWEKIDVARGIAVYDPQEDETVNDVIRRADKNMYENKWISKQHQAQAQSESE